MVYPYSKKFKDSMIKLHGTICLDNIPVSVVGLFFRHSCPGSLTTSRNETSLYTNMSKTMKLFYKHPLGKYMANDSKKGRLHISPFLLNQCIGYHTKPRHLYVCPQVPGQKIRHPITSSTFTIHPSACRKASFGHECRL